LSAISRFHDEVVRRVFAEAVPYEQAREGVLTSRLVFLTEETLRLTRVMKQWADAHDKARLQGVGAIGMALSRSMNAF